MKKIGNIHYNKLRNIDLNKYYFDHYLEASKRGNGNRISFLGFLITINIAIFYGIYTKDNCFEELINCVPRKNILFIVQFLINFIISIIYFREHKISKVSIEITKEFIQNSLIGNYISKIDKIDKINLGITWFCIRLILSILIIFPFIAYFESNFYDIEYCKIGLYSIIFILLLIGFHFYIFRIVYSLCNKLCNCLLSKLENSIINNLYKYLKEKYNNICKSNNKC